MDFEPRNMPFAFLRLFTMKEYEALPGQVKGKLLAFYVMKILEALNDYRDWTNANSQGSIPTSENK
jgi:hypothetical protein